MINDIEGWQTGSFSNNGWPLKLSDTEETSANGSVRGFDSRTGTLPPTL